ncbi:hypothetical protein ACP70R_047649 [Stipagrostis hirtigluma subsp. patula]
MREDSNCDKADWSSKANNAAFCELCVEEIRAGNKNGRYLTARGYENIATKFEEVTGLHHSKRQFKNRWEALQRLYNFWLGLNKATGLGRGRGTVVADDEWWRENTQHHSEWKRLRYGPPDNLAELEVMFQNTAVDGSSSCIPGGGVGGDREGDEADGDYESPMSISSLKRGAGTSATSPKKRTKSPMVKVMKGIWNTMQETSAAAQKALQVQVDVKADAKAEAITKVMRLAVDSGAVEGSDEHFMASILFVKASYRAMFLTFTSNEARLGWLKRWCKKKNI